LALIVTFDEDRIRQNKMQEKTLPKCRNCSNVCTGIVEGFCCKKCSKGKLGHGKRCLQININDKNWKEKMKNKFHD